MRLSLCLLLCLAVSCIYAQSQVPALLWTSEAVFDANAETSASYQTLRFVDLWNAVLNVFVSDKDVEPNGFFVPTNNQPEVFILFVSSQLTPWQLSGDVSVSEPLRSAFKNSAARFSFNNVYLESGQVMDFVPESLRAAGADVSYLGSCGRVDSEGFENGLKTYIKKQTNKNPKVIVVCGGGSLEDEMAQVAAVDTAAKDAKLGYAMMFVSEFEDAYDRVEYINSARRRTLKQSEAVMPLPIDYNFCDNLCHTRVKFLEGIILALVLALALTAGLCCMNILDVPSQFEKPDDTET